MDNVIPRYDANGSPSGGATCSNFIRTKEERSQADKRETARIKEKKEIKIEPRRVI
jgi:hypothetical protein